MKASELDHIEEVGIFEPGKEFGYKYNARSLDGWERGRLAAQVRAGRFVVVGEFVHFGNALLVCRPGDEKAATAYHTTLN